MSAQAECLTHRSFIAVATDGIAQLSANAEAKAWLSPPIRSGINHQPAVGTAQALSEHILEFTVFL